MNIISWLYWPIIVPLSLILWAKVFGTVLQIVTLIFVDISKKEKNENT